LVGRIALVSGASRGLGAEIATRFREQGADLLLCARNVADLEEVAHGLPDGPGRVVTLGADVGDEAQVDAMFDRLATEFGRLDVLVNNAGIYGPMGNIETVSWPDWADAIRINLLSVVYMCRKAVPLMRAQASGKIINLSGGGATNPLPAVTAYAASKAAVVRFTESLALEVRDAGIDVNAVAPGALNTRMMDQLLEAGAERVGEAFHQRMSKIAAEGGTPLSVGAGLCVFLASSDSDGITGKLISAQWDRWEDWPRHLEALGDSDIYTLRRITGRDRGIDWGDC
jgi:3-oxoacyl-[acyl-carrier protein] reductase